MKKLKKTWKEEKKTSGHYLPSKDQKISVEKAFLTTRFPTEKTFKSNQIQLNQNKNKINLIKNKINLQRKNNKKISIVFFCFSLLIFSLIFLKIFGKFLFSSFQIFVNKKFCAFFISLPENLHIFLLLFWDFP